MSMGVNTSFLVQPSIIRLEPGKPLLRVYFRDRRAAWIYTALSTDDGKTWETPHRTNLPNNNAGIQAIVLQSDKVAIVFNDMQGQTSHNLRNVLAIGLSSDGGATFPIQRLLENRTSEEIGVAGIGPSTCECYSYPTALQTTDGNIGPEQQP